MVDREQRNNWAEMLQNFLQQPSLSAVSGWKADSNDNTLSEVITELQERLTIVLPVRPQADIQQQAIETTRGTIERVILLLRSNHEFPPERWTLENTWFPCSLGVSISCLLLSGLFESQLLHWMAFVVLGTVIAFLWVTSIGFYIMCCWQIFQVRILRRDLTSKAVDADQRDFWPFESDKVFRSTVAAFNKTAQNS